MYKIIYKLFKFQTAIFFAAVLLAVSFFSGTTFAEEKMVEEILSDNIYSFKDGGLRLCQFQDKDKRLTLGGEISTRFAYWNWFQAPSDNNEYNYGFQMTRLNLKFSSKYMNIFVQPQYVHMFGLPDDEKL